MSESESPSTDEPVGLLAKALDWIERVGNKLPDPALLFFMLLIFVWLLSAVMSQFNYEHVDPRSGTPIVVSNLLTGEALTSFFSNMVSTFVQFHPLGVVLLAMLGIGVADHTGFIKAGLRALLNVTSQKLLTPTLLLIGIISHSAVDAGYVLVIPLGAVIFQAAGRHPLVGIAVAFAGVSGGFSANFVPSALDPMLQGISQAGAQLIDPDLVLTPLNNWFFTSASTLLIIGLGWYITDALVEPRLKHLAVDGDLAQESGMAALSDAERGGLTAAVVAMGLGVGLLVLTAFPEGSAWRAPYSGNQG